MLIFSAVMSYIGGAGVIFCVESTVKFRKKCNFATDRLRNAYNL